MWMVERREYPSLRDEARAHGRISTERARELFDRDESSELPMAACEDHTARPPAELAPDLIGGKSSDDSVVDNHRAERVAGRRSCHTGHEPQRPCGPLDGGKGR